MIYHIVSVGCCPLTTLTRYTQTKHAMIQRYSTQTEIQSFGVVRAQHPTQNQIKAGK